MPQGISAELIADKWGISRDDMDAFGVRSRSSAPREPTDEGRFEREILAGARRRRAALMTVDEGLRETTLESLGQAQAVVPVRGGGRPGHRRQLVADHRRRLGAADHERGAGGGARADAAGPVRRVRARRRRPAADAHGADPGHRTRCSNGPGMTIDDIDLVEINEAFASVVLAWEKELHPDMDRVNVNGGAIALGHPLGCSGARLMTTLLTSSSARAAATACRRCARAAGWPTPPSSNASAERSDGVRSHAPGSARPRTGDNRVGKPVIVPCLSAASCGCSAGC